MTTPNIEGLGQPQTDEVRGFLSNFKPTLAPPWLPAYSSTSNSCHSDIPLASFFASRLPRDLQMLILAHLPALKLMELEGTCPSVWKPVIHSPACQDQWRRLHQEGGRYGDKEKVTVWLLNSITRDDQTLVAYIPAQRKYYLFLPMLFRYASLTPPTGMSMDEMKAWLKNSVFVSATGPWIAFQRQTNSSCVKLVVCNTVTGQTTCLPILQLEHYGLDLSASTPIIKSDNEQSFCVMVAGEMSIAPSTSPRRSRSCEDVLNSVTIFVYDSSSQYSVWISEHYDMGFGHTASRTGLDLVLNGDLFICNHEMNELYVWYRSTCSWVTLDAGFATTQQPDGPVNIPPDGKVVKCANHLLLVTSNVTSNEEKGFTIWKLTAEDHNLLTCEWPGHGYSWKWDQLSTTPADLIWKSFGPLHPTYLVDNSNICIMPSSTSEYMPPLVYNVAHDEWYNLPGLLKNVQAVCAMELSLTGAVGYEDQV